MEPWPPHIEVVLTDQTGMRTRAKFSQLAAGELLATHPALLNASTHRGDNAYLAHHCTPDTDIGIWHKY